MANSKKKKKHQHKPLPQGMTYAEKLAQERMVKEAVEKAAKDHTVKLQSDIRVQQAQWLQIVGFARGLHLGPTRVGYGLDGIAAASEWFIEMCEKHGKQYALEKLRQEAEKVTGIPIEYLYERDIAEARKRNEERGVFFSIIEEETP